MPDPETDISAQSRGDELPDLEGPDEDDAEASYDPDAIEVSRARELGLGVGERDLQMQRDVHGSGPATRDGDVERLETPADYEAAGLDVEEEAEESRAREEKRDADIRDAATPDRA